MCPDPSPSGLRILVVDDDTEFLRDITGFLEGLGNEVVTAGGGRHALALALQGDTQVVITSWAMQEMDGVQLCKTLRRFGSGRKLYILVLADREEETRVAEALEAGADDYVLKPLQRAELATRLRRGQRVIRLVERIERDKRAQREHVAELAVMTRRLRTAVLTDDVTALPNQRSLLGLLKKERVAARRDGLALGVLRIDLVDWEVEGEVRGMLARDAAMATAAGLLRKSFPPRSTVVFWGGESFVVLQPDVTRGDLESLARRCLGDLNATAVDAEGRKVRLQAIAGLAMDDGSFEVPLDVIEAAEGARLRAKDHRGGSCSW